MRSFLVRRYARFSSFTADFHRDPLDYFNSEPGDPYNFAWIVGKQPEFRHPEIPEDLTANVVVTHVRVESRGYWFASMVSMPDSCRE